MNLTLMTDTEILEMLASRARRSRIANDFRQSDLSQKSGVPLSSIRVFERSGKVSFVYLVKILRALSLVEELDGLFKIPEIVDLKTTLNETETSRKRVRK